MLDMNFIKFFLTILKIFYFQEDLPVSIIKGILYFVTYSIKGLELYSKMLSLKQRTYIICVSSFKIID